MNEKGIRYTIKGDVVTRHVLLGSNERLSSLKIASWIDRSQNAGALYDIAAWLTAKKHPNCARQMMKYELSICFADVGDFRSALLRLPVRYDEFEMGE